MLWWCDILLVYFHFVLGDFSRDFASDLFFWVIGDCRACIWSGGAGSVCAQIWDWCHCARARGPCRSSGWRVGLRDVFVVVYVCMCMCAFMNACMYALMRVYVEVCMCACMYALCCVYMCMCVCIRMYTYFFMYLCLLLLYTHTHTHTHTHLWLSL
jgi:hypothetical protein